MGTPSIRAAVIGAGMAGRANARPALRVPAGREVRHQGDPSSGDRGVLGPAAHFNGHYSCDYGFDPDAPMSWRYRGSPGSGALADIGAHPGVGHGQNEFFTFQARALLEEITGFDERPRCPRLAEALHGLRIDAIMASARQDGPAVAIRDEESS